MSWNTCSKSRGVGVSRNAGASSTWDLPESAKYLLLASHIASQTPPTLDVHLFDFWGKDREEATQVGYLLP